MAKVGNPKLIPRFGLQAEEKMSGGRLERVEIDPNQNSSTFNIPIW
jgi:hypothetical protein